MILVLGSSGYIGSEFVRQLGDRCVVMSGQLKYQSFDYMRRIVSELKPELVVNCAAFVTRPSVDLCEEHKDRTLLGNLVAPVIIQNACELSGVPMMHVSSACLFNGDNGGKGWSEDDEPQLSYAQGKQCGTYVGSKELAERALQGYAKTYICRIRLVFDEFDDRRNYISKLMRYPKVYTNTNSLSHRGDFVTACLDLHRLKAPFGTYNVVNRGAITAREICSLINAHLVNRRFEFFEEEDFMNNVAKTPKSNCVLSTNKLERAGVSVRSVTDAVDQSLRNWIAEVPASR